MPPQPQHPRLATPLATGQSFDLHQDERADHYGQEPAAAPPFVRSHLRVHLREGPHAHRSVAGVLARILGGRFGPGARVVTLHLWPVATRASGAGGWACEARVGAEAATRPQTDEDLARRFLQSPLHLDRVVAGVEDEQGNGPSFPEPVQQGLHLLGGDLVGVLGGTDALYIHGGGPALADEVQLCYELVGPSGHDRLPRRMAGRMVVVSSGSSILARGCTPRRIWATRSCPRRRRASFRS